MHRNRAVAGFEERTMAKPAIHGDRTPYEPVAVRRNRELAVHWIHDQRVTVDHEIHAGVAASEADMNESFVDRERWGPKLALKAQG